MHGIQRRFLLPAGILFPPAPHHFRPCPIPFPHWSWLTDVYWGPRGTPLNWVRVSVGRSVTTAAVTVTTFRDKSTRSVVMRPPQRTRRTHARERGLNVECLSGRVCYPPPLLPAPLPLHPPHYMSVSEIVTTAETTRKTPLYLSLKK